MRLLVLLCAIAMPIVAYFSQAGTFGPTNGAVAMEYPTLLLAAGYAFAIWGLIFLCDLLYAIWQATGTRRGDASLSLIAPWTATGFAATAMWMPMFSQGRFWICLVLIVLALVCLLRSAIVLTDDAKRLPRQWLWAWTPISLHAGWLSVAVFLNIAQVIVAYRLLSTTDMLPWSLVLFGALAVLLLWANHRMRGNVDYAGAAAWGLLAVHVMQHQWDVRGAFAASWCALALAVVLIAQTVWLRFKWRGGLVADATGQSGVP
jgi:hypothetical protein